jgi:hypothetical protein
MDEMCASCETTLRPGEEFCPQCGAPVVLRHSRPPRGRRGVVAAAVGGGTLISVLGVFLALVLLRPAPAPTAAESSAPSASPTAVADPSGEPSSSPQPDPSSTPVATEPPSSGALANRAVAAVAVAGLNLRREPGGGAEIFGTLDEGARVFVIGAPQLVDDVAWYRVAVVDGPYSGCTEQRCPSTVGWVAEGGTGEDAWLRPVGVDCPSSPMTAEELTTLLPLERLSCYGAEEIVVSGTLDVCYCDANAPLTWEPFWLAMPLAPFLFHDTFTFIRFEEEPPADLQIGDVVRATLAMEHEAASTCIVRGNPNFFGPMPSGETPPVIDEPDRAQTVLGCRTQLVMKSFEVIGFEDVSLPGS